MNYASSQSQTATQAPTGAGNQAAYFSRSSSQAQGYHAAPSPSLPQPVSDMPMFSHSRSEPQAIVQAERSLPSAAEGQDKQAHRGVGWRLKNAFLKSENVVSTWMTVGFIKAWADKTMGAWGVSSPLTRLTAEGAPLGGLAQKMPAIPGMDKFSALAYGKNFDKSKLVSTNNAKPETLLQKTMAVGVTGALMQNLAFFMTTRGGEIPEGDTITQRLLNSLKNPDKHAVHFSNATMSGFIGLIGASRLAMGVQGMMANPPESGKKNTMMIISGLSALVSAPLVFTGLFQMTKDGNAPAALDPQEAAKKQEEMLDKAEQAFAKGGDKKHEGAKLGKGILASVKPGHLKDMWQYAMKNDKKGLVGRALAVTMELGFMLDGRMQLQKDPTDRGAHATVKGGLTGLVLTCMQTHFVYDRLLSTAQKEKGAGMAR